MSQGNQVRAKLSLSRGNSTFGPLLMRCPKAGLVEVGTFEDHYRQKGISR